MFFLLDDTRLLWILSLFRFRGVLFIFKGPDQFHLLGGFGSLTPIHLGVIPVETGEIRHFQGLEESIRRRVVDADGEAQFL